jgi:hypothetical protein
MNLKVADDIGDNVTIENAVARDPDAFAIKPFNLPSRQSTKVTGNLVHWRIAPPRTGNAGLHDLHELMVIALCAVLSGGQGATHMAAFAVAKEPFLRSFLKLENGLPSHDTFSRLFRLLDPEQFPNRQI